MDVISYNASSFIYIILVIIILNILVIIISFTGSMATWYSNLIKGPINLWGIVLVWGLSTLLSYIGLFLFYRLGECRSNNKNLALTVLFFVNALLTLGWVTIFFYGENIGLSLWLVGVLFMYMFWVFIYMWYNMPTASVFIVPLLMVYLYVFYAMAHLAYLNNVLL